MMDLRTVRQPLVAVLLLVSLAPSIAFGQNAKAGVVTTLEGNVVALRGGTPQPVPLKFRDDVFLDDRITTGDRSIARLLLGGKAVVTVRERSSLTVTEVPGRATISLDSGKIAVAVARERMRPGETLEVRTPNAVAGVRGTVFIVDVSQATAQATPPGRGGVTTQIVTLQGSVGVQFVGPAGAALGSVLVGANQFAAHTGTSGTPRSGTLTPEQRAAALAGLQATIRTTGAANSDQVKEQLTQTTAAALGALLGDAGTLFLPGVSPLRNPADASTSTTNQLNNGTLINACTTDPTVCQPRSASRASTATGIPGSLLINDLSGQLVANDPHLSTPNPNPYVVSVSDGPIMNVPAGLAAPVVATSGDLFAITQGGTPVTTLLPRPLLLTRSDLTVSQGSLLRVDDVLASFGTAPLLSVDSATLEANTCARCSGGGLVVVSGVDRFLAVVAGSLLSAHDATITTHGDVLALDDQAVLSSGTTGPLVSVTGQSTLTTRGFFSLDTEAVAVLTAPLLVATSTTGRHSLAFTGDFVGVTGGAILAYEPVLPTTALVQSDHTDYDVGHGGVALRDFLRFEGTGGGGLVPSATLLTGPLLASSQDTFNVTGAMLAVNSGAPGALVSLTSFTTSPLMSFDGGRVTLGAAACGANPGCIASATGTGNVVQVQPFASVTLNGAIATVTAPSQGWVMDTLLSSSGSGGLTTSSYVGPLFSFDGATGTPHTVNGAMFDLGGFTTTTVDSDPDAPATVLLGTDQPLRHGGTLYQGTGGASMTTTNVLKLDTALMAAMAPLVSLAGAGTSLTSASDAFALTQQAKLTASIPADALVKVNTGATFTVTNGSLVNVAGGSFASLNVGALVSLSGGSTLSLLNGFLATVSGNGSFSLTGALVSFTGSNNTLVVNNALAPTGFINGVPVYSSLGGIAGFNITRTNANLFTGLNTNNNVIQINGVPLSTNATTATGSLLAITGVAAGSKIKVQ
jgi:FecR protein